MLEAAESNAVVESQDDGWEWAVVEILGHRRHTGRIRQEERFGTKMMRVDVPIDGDPEAKGYRTHYYAGAALYGLTPCTRETALKANKPCEDPIRYALAGPRDADHDEDGPF